MGFLNVTKTRVINFISIIKYTYCRSDTDFTDLVGSKWSQLQLLVSLYSPSIFWIILYAHIKIKCNYLFIWSFILNASLNKALWLSCFTYLFYHTGLSFYICKIWNSIYLYDQAFFDNQYLIASTFPLLNMLNPKHYNQCTQEFAK